jgi:hypothetical protein
MRGQLNSKNQQHLQDSLHVGYSDFTGLILINDQCFPHDCTFLESDRFRCSTRSERTYLRSMKAVTEIWVKVYTYSADTSRTAVKLWSKQDYCSNTSSRKGKSFIPTNKGTSTLLVSPHMYHLEYPCREEECHRV